MYSNHSHRIDFVIELPPNAIHRIVHSNCDLRIIIKYVNEMGWLAYNFSSLHVIQQSCGFLDEYDLKIELNLI